MRLSDWRCHPHLEKLGGSTPLTKMTQGSSGHRSGALCKNFHLFSQNSEVIQHSQFKMRKSLKT